MVDVPVNPIEEYLVNNTSSSDFIDLFDSDTTGVPIDEHNIALRTDLSIQEIVLINTIILNSSFLESKGIDSNIYTKFVTNYMRLKVSKDRLSRKEFVDINKRERFESNLDKFNSFSQLKKVKE